MAALIIGTPLSAIEKASFERHQEPVLAPMVAGFAGVAAGVVDHVVEEPVHGEFGDPGIVPRVWSSERKIRVLARDRKSVVQGKRGEGRGYDGGGRSNQKK